MRNRIRSIWYSAAQFIVFREKRKMDWREILREKWATKNSRKTAGKTAKNGLIFGRN